MLRNFWAGIAAIVVAWLVVSLLLTVMSIVFNPMAWLAIQMSGGEVNYNTYNTYTALNGIFILVLTLILARSFYRKWKRPVTTADEAPLVWK